MYCDYDPPQATSCLHPHDAANCNGCAARKKPGGLKFYKKFRSTMPDIASSAMMMG